MSGLNQNWDDEAICDHLIDGYAKNRKVIDEISCFMQPVSNGSIAWEGERYNYPDLGKFYDYIFGQYPNFNRETAEDLYRTVVPFKCVPFWSSLINHLDAPNVQITIVACGYREFFIALLYSILIQIDVQKVKQYATLLYQSDPRLSYNEQIRIFVYDAEELPHPHAQVIFALAELGGISEATLAENYDRVNDYLKKMAENV